jgi:hypothetical protein
MSDRMKETASQSNVRVSKAILLSDGIPLMDLPITSGSVTVDTEAAIRRTCDITIEGRDDLVPASAVDTLFPRVNEIKLYNGFQYEPADPRVYRPADEELIPQGVFRIDKPDIEYSEGAVSISIGGLDRSSRVQGNSLSEPYVVPAGRPYSTAIADFLLDRDPRAQLNFETINYRTPQIIIDVDADPWGELLKMASAIGCELFYDQDGIAILRPEPNPALSPVVWEYLPNSQNLAVKLKKTIDGSYGYNHVVVRGFSSTGEDGPVLAEAWDDDPRSPTFAGDPLGSSDYGAVTYTVSSQFISTQAQGQAYADSTLLRVLGAGETISCEALVLPGQDAGDIIHMQWDPLRLNGRMAIKSLTMPMGDDQEMTFETKRRQVL